MLPIDSQYLKTLSEISDEDLKVAGDLTDERRFGQRSDTLPWFWRIGEGVNTNSPRMHECMYYCFHIIVTYILLLIHFSVYRVSWLRAKACLARWSEELRLVEYEMEWTVNWFQSKVKQWQNRLRDLVDEE